MNEDRAAAAVLCGKQPCFSVFQKNLKKLKKVLAFLKTLVYTKQVGCEQRSTEQYGQLVKGLRRRPLTAKTRVRFPYWLLEKISTSRIKLHIHLSRCSNEESAEQRGQLVKGLRRRPLTAKTRVRFPYWLLKNNQSFLWLFFFPNLSKNIESPKTVLKNSEGYGMI